jgi:hypothetical protein
MTTEATNPATQYCFPAEAVNQFFSDTIFLSEFTREMRALIYSASMKFMSDCDGCGYIPDEIYSGIDHLNSLIEVLDPYLFPKDR